MSYIEASIRNLVQWLRLGVETTGAVIVALGVSLSLILFVQAALSRRPANFNAIRLVLARYLALALEFQLGADILSTAVAPTWNEIGKLASIAVVRTVLNYFLSREMKEEQNPERSEATVAAHAERSAI